MKILFVHQNLPGQFAHLIAALAVRGQDRLVCLSRRPEFTPPGIGRVTYRLPDETIASDNPFLGPLENAVRHGLAAARACEALGAQGFRPDVIVGHPGWGETLYLREIFPAARLLHYCEFFYRPHGADVNFDPESRQDLTGNAATWTRNAPLLLALEGGDWGMSPTSWQRGLHPDAQRSRISVRFDGIDTDAARPDPLASLTLADGTVLRAGEEIVTFVARGLEPHRGFPSFMRALPAILRARPQARVLIAGADENVYGPPPPGGGTWRARLTEEVGWDPARVHFLGHIPRAAYLRVLQVSAAHVYLTVPFVLSWSMLEAMAAGCLVIGSATAPVQEVIDPGRNGVLVDFFSPGAIADAVVAALADPASAAPIRAAARWTALSRYALDRCVPRQIALIEAVAAGGPLSPD